MTSGKENSVAPLSPVKRSPLASDLELSRVEEMKRLRETVNDQSDQIEKLSVAVEFLLDAVGTVFQTYHDPSQSGRRRTIDPLVRPLASVRENFLYGDKPLPLGELMRRRPEKQRRATAAQAGPSHPPIQGTSNADAATGTTIVEDAPAQQAQSEAAVVTVPPETQTVVSGGTIISDHEITLD